MTTLEDPMPARPPAEPLPAPSDVVSRLPIQLMDRNARTIGPTLAALADAVAQARGAGVPEDAYVSSPAARAPLFDLEFEWTRPWFDAPGPVRRTWRERAHAVLDAVLVRPWLNR